MMTFFRFICIACAIILMGIAVIFSVFLSVHWIYAQGGLAPFLAVFLILSMIGIKFMMDGPR